MRPDRDGVSRRSADLVVHALVAHVLVLSLGACGFLPVSTMSRANTDVLERAPKPTPVDSEFDGDRKSTRLNSSHVSISYAVFCLKKKKNQKLYSAISFKH